jgi:hypothetical protein
LVCNYKPTGVVHIVSMMNDSNKSNALNSIAKLLGTTDKNLVISAAISVLVKEAGIDLAKAYDIVLGEGAYVKAAGHIYDELNK